MVCPHCQAPVTQPALSCAGCSRPLFPPVWQFFLAAALDGFIDQLLNGMLTSWMPSGPTSAAEKALVQMLFVGIGIGTCLLPIRQARIIAGAAIVGGAASALWVRLFADPFNSWACHIGAEAILAVVMVGAVTYRYRSKTVSSITMGLVLLAAIPSVLFDAGREGLFAACRPGAGTIPGSWAYNACASIQSVPYQYAGDIGWILRSLAIGTGLALSVAIQLFGNPLRLLALIRAQVQAPPP